MEWKIRQRIDVERGYPRAVVYADELMVPGDNSAHQWLVEVFEHGSPYDLSGCNCTASFIRDDGNTVFVTGTVSENVASVILPSACYAIQGPVRGILRISKNSQVASACETYFVVREGITGSVVDPGEVIPNLDDLLAQIEAMETATASATDAAESANAAASDATEASSTANASAQNAAEKAAAANAAAAAANAAAANANSAASNAEEGASAADSAAQSANAAADRVDDAIGSANTAAANAENKAALADAAAQSADTAADNADNKATAAEAAAAAANAAANRLSAVELDVTMLPPSAEPAASVEQTETKTTFSLGIPTSNLAYATFEVDATMELLMHSPDGFDDINFSLNNGVLEVSV